LKGREKKETEKGKNNTTTTTTKTQKHRRFPVCLPDFLIYTKQLQEHTHKTGVPKGPRNLSIQEGVGRREERVGGKNPPRTLAMSAYLESSWILL